MQTLPLLFRNLISISLLTRYVATFAELIVQGGSQPPKNSLHFDIITLLIVLKSLNFSANTSPEIPKYAMISQFCKIMMLNKNSKPSL